MQPDRVPRRAPTGALAALALPALVLAFPASAPADAPWSVPRSVGPSNLELGHVVVGRRGASLTYGYGGVPELVPVSADGTPGRVRRVPNVRDVEAYADRAVFLRSATRDRPEGLSFGDLGARSLGPLHPVTRRGETVDLMTVGARGDVLAAAATGSGGESAFDAARFRYRLVWSGPGRRARPSSRALPGRAELLAAAVDARGSAVLLLQRPTTTGDFLVTARTLRLRSGRLGPERRLDRTKLDRIDGSVAVDDDGGAVLAWGMQDGGEEADRRYVVRAAFRRRSTTAFTPAVTLDPGGEVERPGFGPRAAMDQGGRSTVAWTQAAGELGGPTLPRAAVATRTARFGPVAQLLPEGYVSDVATAGDTTLVAVTGSAGAPADPSTGLAAAPTVAGVLTRRGAAPLGPIEPVATPAPGDLSALSVAGGAAGFRAVWDGAGADGRGALRWASRAGR
jgi:hypothetical protein